MDRSKALEFIDAYSHTNFYQPVVFVSDRMEIRGRWHQATKELANILFSDVSGKTVLDLGCNIGFFVHESLRKGALKCIGVDHDIVEVSIAQKLRDIFNDNSTIIQFDIDEFVPNCKFDIILMLNVCFALASPYDTIQRYRKYCTEHLVVEHDSARQNELPVADRIAKSPRCTPGRNLSYYSPLE